MNPQEEKRGKNTCILTTPHNCWKRHSGAAMLFFFFYQIHEHTNTDAAFRFRCGTEATAKSTGGGEWWAQLDDESIFRKYTGEEFAGTWGGLFLMGMDLKQSKMATNMNYRWNVLLIGWIKDFEAFDFVAIPPNRFLSEPSLRAETIDRDHVILSVLHHSAFNAVYNIQFHLNFDSDNVLDWCADGPICRCAGAAQRYWYTIPQHMKNVHLPRKCARAHTCVFF